MEQEEVEALIVGDDREELSKAEAVHSDLCRTTMESVPAPIRQTLPPAPVP